jgi:hypothetical protein
MYPRFENPKVERSDDPPLDWFTTPEAPQLAEEYLRDKYESTKDRYASLIKPGETEASFRRRLAIENSTDIFPSIPKGEFRIETGQVLIEGKNISLESLSPQLIKLLAEPTGAMSQNPLRYLREFSSLVITTPEEKYDMMELAKGYKIIAPLSTSANVARITYSDEGESSSRVFIEENMIFVNHALSTPEGIYALMHEIGHIQVDAVNTRQHNQKSAEIRNTDRELTVVEKVLIIEDERLATAFALKAIGKISRFINIPMGAIVASAYEGLECYVSHHQ